MSELENDVMATEPVAKRTKKVPTAEEIAAMREAIDLFAGAGIISEKTNKVLTLVDKWHDTEANKETKEEVIEYFGGQAEFKDYIEGEFTAELAKIQALVKVLSVGNSIRSFYSRRPSTRGSRATVQLIINGAPYTVNQAFYQSLAGLSAEEKKAALLEHKDTKKNEVEEL